jgi:hypothetical protein
MGWVDGLTLQLRVKDAGARLACGLPPGHVEDRTPVPPLAKRLWGQCLGERGDLSQAWQELLLAQGLARLTKIRTRRKHRRMRLWEKLLLRQRARMETIHDPVQHISQIEPTRHRRVTGFMVHLLAGLVAYTYHPTKPSLGLQRHPLLPVSVV